MIDEPTVSKVAESQVKAISDYIAYGIEHGCGDCIGLELEHFIVSKDDHAYVPFFDDPASGRPGVKSILERLSPYYDEEIIETRSNGCRNLIGLARDYATITLEPGAQFEISIGPVLEIRDLEIAYSAFRRELDSVLEEFGYEAIEVGYHPSIRAHEVPLLPKDRYEFMDEHFAGTGRHGICMMRATASTQVSIDFDSEEDAIRKFRVANALTPLFAFITDNSPVFELEPLGSGESIATGLPIPNRMVRTAIWDDVDAARSMTAPDTFEPGFCFDSYAKSVLSTPAIFSVENDGLVKRSVRQKDRAFSEVYENAELDCAAIEHMLSLYFFDVRFKTYIEIRAADSLPIPYALAFAALVKGLFYDKDVVSELAHRFEGLSAEDIVAAKLALRDQAFDSKVYGLRTSEWLDELYAKAFTSLPKEERDFLSPLGRLIGSRKTLIDRL
jgi:glutamate--cysteine ligase